MLDLDLVRNKLFNLRMSAEEMARLDALAKHYGLTTSAVVRMLVKRDADALKVEGKPRKR